MDEKAEAAKRLLSFRQRRQGVCRQCGKTFEGWALRIYCSNACKLKAFRARRKPAGGEES